MVFEYMDHDLTGLADRPGMKFSVPQIKCASSPVHALLVLRLLSCVFALSSLASD